jgi:hypothetical protein
MRLGRGGAWAAGSLAFVAGKNQALWFIKNLMIFVDIRKDSF